MSIAQTYLKIMNRFCEQFGLTPSSRSRIVAERISKAMPWSCCCTKAVAADV
nr:MAG TPA: terminase small subunit [Caudoviricetes sp.]